MNEDTSKGSKMSVPFAIIVAGVIIGGAIFMSNTSGGQPSSTQSSKEPAANPFAEITITPVSETDHVLGNPGAPLAAIVFTDTECPFCKSFHSTMQQVANAYGKDGKVAWVYRHFPIEQLHAKAKKEAEATECAAELGGQTAFWKYVDTLFAATPSNDGLDPAKLPEFAKTVGIDVVKFNECLGSGKHAEKVQTQYEEAVASGGRGTPYTVFVSKTPITTDTEQLIQSLQATMPPETLTISTDKYRIAMSGALPYQMVDQIIKSILK